MKKLLTILLVLISFSTFAQFEAGEYINSDTVKLDGVPLLLNTFKQGNLGGASNIFYSTGASSQPASGSVNQVIGGNSLTASYVPKWDGSKFADSWINQNLIDLTIGNGNDFKTIINSGGFWEVLEAKGTGQYSSFLLTKTGSNTGYMTYDGEKLQLSAGTHPYSRGDFNILNSGLIGINTTDPSERLDVNGNAIADVLKSRVPTGTPPLVVASSTKVDNLNVSFLEGHPASYFETANVNIQRHITNDNDTIIDNEIQNLSRDGNTLSLSSDGTTVDLSDLVNPDLSGYRLKTNHDSLSALDEKSYISLTDKPTSLPASDVYPWAKAATKPKYTYSEVGAQPAGSYATTTQLADQLSQTITNGVTTKAPSEDAVFDALAGKATVSGTDNYIMKKTGANTIGNSNLIDYGSFVNSSVQINAPNFYAGSTSYGAGWIEFGMGRVGNNYTAIDFTGDQTYTDYGLRIIRSNEGANANGALLYRGKGDFSILSQDAGRVILGTKNINSIIIDSLQNVGVGTQIPAARIHSQSTTTQLRLGYDENKYTDLSTGSTGDLTITPSGGEVIVAGDIVGDSIRAANFKMSTGAGLNKIIYSDATGNFIWGNQSSTLLAIAGVTPSTGYLYYNGSTFSYASGGSAQWTADTYGIKYTSGKVGIGTGSDSGNLLTIGDPSTNTNIAIRAASINERAIYATSTNNTAITAQASLDGVSGVGGRYGVNGASTNGTGVRGSSTYGYGGEFSGLGINISAGGLSIGGTTRISSTGTFTPSNGVSGSFTSADGKTITVTNGIITGIN